MTIDYVTSLHPTYTADAGLRMLASVRVADVGSDHVTLVWHSPGGASLELYEVGFWTDELPRNISVVYTLHPNVTLRGLRHQSDYMFRVRSVVLIIVV